MTGSPTFPCDSLCALHVCYTGSRTGASTLSCVHPTDGVSLCFPGYVLLIEFLERSVRFPVRLSVGSRNQGTRR